MRKRTASMGPPIFIGGNRGKALPLDLLAPASMGPPIFIGGNTASVAIFARLPRLQWGRRFSSAEIIKPNGGPLQRLTLQWGRRFSSAEILRDRAVYLHHARASMGPPIFIGGNRCMFCRVVFVRLASMGPPIFIGGNRYRAALGMSGVRGFNGAADFHRRKFVRRGNTDIRGRIASMGPPIFIGGNLTVRGFSLWSATASMGPPIFIGGNVGQVRPKFLLLIASMGPPIFIGGNVARKPEDISDV